MASTRRYHRRVAAAVGSYLGAGWSVVPGAWWDGHEGRYRCAASGCRTEGLHLTAPQTPERAIRCGDAAAPAVVGQRQEVRRCWTRRPYSVLFPTGHSADVLEVPASRAKAVLATLHARGHRGPIATLPNAGVLIFTAAAGPRENARVADLLATGTLHHARGSWVPLPPSRLADGHVSWRQSPVEVGWYLPALDTVGAVADRVEARSLTG